MPVQDDIGVAEQSGADHVDLAAATLFSGSSVVAQRTRQVILFHVLFQRDRGKSGSSPEQVVSAAVARRRFDDGGPVWRRSLRKTGESVKFAEDADNRFSLAIAGNKSRGLVRNTCL